MRTDELHLNYGALIKLAEKDDFELIPGVSALPDDIKAAVERKRKEAAEEAAEEAADQILVVLKGVQSDTEAKASMVRDYKKTIEGIRKDSDKRNRLLAYAEETQNWLPLSVHLGLIHNYAIDSELLEIPKNWEPTKKEEG